MRIGLVPAYHYGMLLQSYAKQRTAETLGHDTGIIDYERTNLSFSEDSE
jgi:hypothetical protein